METTTRKITVSIAEDQLIFRQGLANILNTFDRLEVICLAENGFELLQHMETQTPDIAIVDFRMPILNGIETTRQICERFPSTKVLILSMYSEDEFVKSAIENGANGYLSKDDDPLEIAKAIYSIIETGYYLNDRTSKLLIANMMQKGKIKPKFTGFKEQLTDSEKMVLRLICEELTTQEIADKIFKSKRTVETIRTNLLQKTGAKNIAGLVMYAVKNELVS
jgi:two-component system, NarL family, response regulator NreC|uniref:response regulator n=1 Tax=Fluviicola sp. TaxID=1917219 RepID=UPI00404AD751